MSLYHDNKRLYSLDNNTVDNTMNFPVYSISTNSQIGVAYTLPYLLNNEPTNICHFKNNNCLQQILTIDTALNTYHRVLLNYLSSWFGLSGVVLGWFASYLPHRNQFVKVGDILSDPADLIYGVAQGSVLGLILFSLYTTPLNKIPSTYKTVNHHFYADDTQLYISPTPTNFATTIAILPTYLIYVQSWMTTNKLKLNSDKRQFILVGNKSQGEKLAVFSLLIYYVVLLVLRTKPLI